MRIREDLNLRYLFRKHIYWRHGKVINWQFMIQLCGVYFYQLEDRLRRPVANQIEKQLDEQVGMYLTRQLPAKLK